MRFSKISTDVILICTVIISSGCALTSGVMENEDGTYQISSRAAPILGGTVGANQAAYEDAKKFCITKNARAVVVNNSERDVYQSASTMEFSQAGRYSNGSGMSAVTAWGSAILRFRCVQ